MRRLKAAVIGLWLLVNGCAGVQPVRVSTYDCSGNATWTVRPVIVDIDETMSDKCLVATYEALMWWRAQGATYLLPRLMPAHYPGFLGFPEAGHISITSGVLSPGIGGETNPGYLWSSGDMVYADIVISKDHCTPAVVAHELGHALGLSVASNKNHNPERGTLMFWHADGMGWRLSPCERSGIQLSLEPGPGAIQLPSGKQGLTIGGRLVGRFKGK